MGHADRKALLAAFKAASADRAITIENFLDDPSLLDRATQRFIPDLDRLRTSWTRRPIWEHAKYIKRAHDLIKKDYGNERERGGKTLMYFHPFEVADNAFRMCKMFGFNDREATTIWIAALCHDYLERGKQDDDYQRRVAVLHEAFDSHDPDIFNIDYMLTNRDKSRPYFKYVEQIGRTDGFTPQSTYKAQIGVCIVKDCDSGHNGVKSRNLYLDHDLAVANALERNPDPAKQELGRQKAAKVAATKTKVQMYPINQAFMRAKIKGLLGIEGGLPIGATMVDFLVMPEALPYQINQYQSAREVGLGPEENQRYLDRLAQQDEGHDVIIVMPRERPRRAYAAPANDSTGSGRHITPMPPAAV